jgi:putative Holliday junction resolvase
MGRILCIDYGDARIGIAATDELQIAVSPLTTVMNNANYLEEIVAICKDKEPEILVIGMPYGQNGEIGPAAKKIVAFSKKLISILKKNQITIPCYFHDERYTTREAHETMRNIGVKKKRKMAVVDQIAACNILRAFMETSVRYREEITQERLVEYDKD